MTPDYLQVVPLAVAVLCEQCLCITASKGPRCDYCGSTALARLQAMLEMEKVPAAWLEALGLMQD